MQFHHPTWMINLVGMNLLEGMLLRKSNSIFLSLISGAVPQRTESRGQGESVNSEVGAKCLQRLRASVERGIRDYEEALKDGVAPEQARLLVPAYAMYVRWRWTASLNAFLHFVSLRDKQDAQYEIREYAKAVNTSLHQLYPNTTKAWNEFRI